MEMSNCRLSWHPRISNDPFVSVFGAIRPAESATGPLPPINGSLMSTGVAWFQGQAKPGYEFSVRVEARSTLSKIVLMKTDFAAAYCRPTSNLLAR
jgi:hypothetical protein